MKQTLLAILLLMSAQVSAQVRQETVLTDGWQFSHDGESWQSVRVPHDWAIAGPFDKKWDLQRVAIEQNGETEATAVPTPSCSSTAPCRSPPSS